MSKSFARWPRLAITGLLAVVAVTAVIFLSQSRVSSLAPRNPGPDLTAEITLNPTIPGVGQPVTIKVVTRNQGDAATSSFDVHLYVDPPGMPNLNTPDTSLTGFFGLNPGAQFSWEYVYSGFSAIGCNHVVYAWVDRDDEITEDDETNNLVAIPVCVGVTPTPTATPTVTPSPTATATPTTAPCQPDVYEPNASCGAAKSILTDGIHQMHNLCPVGDEDWVKFTATGGITYTIATSNVGADGDTVLRLYNQCNEPPANTSDPTFGNGAQMIFQAPATGEYFLRVKHHDEDYGPAADYQLSITAATTCQGDLFEQDNECAAARDVTVGAAAQRRQFCATGDKDWMKFTALSGASYRLSAAGVGVEAAPKLKLYDQCGLNVTLAEGQAIEWTAAASKTYFVSAENANPALSGPTTAYDFTVTMNGCAPDDFEGDDAPPTATDALPTGAEQTHTFCPLDDRDWVRFPMVVGQLYVIETFELATDADTKVCLFAPDGVTQLACDDDGGGGLASRLRWTATAAGEHYVRVENRRAGMSGPTTAYQLAITAGEPVDAWEEDDSAAEAKAIETNGTPQRRNFTPNGDQDWIKFTAVAGEPYVMRSACVGGDCDTIMHLIDKDGSTELSSNDDYGSGSGSQITYIFPSAGAYYLRVHHYRSNRSGNGTRYDLTVTRNGQTPTPTPTATPIQGPGADSTPPASGIQTLIVTNRERLTALYGEAGATTIMNHLALLADSPLVKGFTIQAENDSAALAAYTAWNNAPRDTTLTNNVSSAVRNLILSHLDNNPSVQYIVIVGNDRVVPFRRFPDRTRYSESRYQAFVTGNTTIWAACRDNMALTDDYYADVLPNLVEGREIYVPDFGISRLPEGPNEIAAFINTFLAGSEITLNRAVITGYDFVTDAGQAMSNTLASDLGPGGAIDGELMGDWWQATAQRDKQFNTTPRFDVQVINGHASHHLHGAPFGGGVNDNDVLNYGASDLTRSLVYTVGCHAGLNDVGGLPAGLDLAQAYFARGANYVANTGYGWGSNNGLGWTERVMTNYTQALTKGASVTIGQALKEAKQRYFTETSAFGAYDEKALMQITLYGLPHYRFISGGVLSDDDLFPSVNITTTGSLDDGDVTTRNVTFNLNGSFDALEPNSLADGDYFDIDGGAQVTANQPMQPEFFANVAAPLAGQIHGVVVREGRYRDVAAVDPLISQPVHEWVPREDWAEPLPASEGWWPPRPASVQSLSSGEASVDRLVTQLGQFSEETGQQRLYDSMDIDLLYAESGDWQGPEISLVTDTVDWAQHPAAARIKVEASDMSGVLGGLATYTAGDGLWRSVDLAYDSASMKWKVEIPATAATVFYVQMIDNAGNVTVADNKGLYYRLAPMLNQVYLPTLLKD